MGDPALVGARHASPLRTSTSGKLCCLGTFSLVIYCLSFRWDSLLPPPPFFPGWYPFEVLFLFIPYSLALRLVWHGTVESRAEVWTIFAFTVLFHLPLLSTEPRISTDVYRYLWDGRVQVAGINPYRYAPEDGALRHLRDDTVYRWINRKEFPTIYPAGAQLVFWGAAELGLTTPTRFKTLWLLADLGSLFLLMRLLAHYQVNRLRALLYAWNPLVVYESAHAGHLEPLVVLCVLAATVAFAKQRTNLGFVSLALGTAVKLYPALLVAVLARGKIARCMTIFLAVLVATYLPYLSAGGQLTGFLPRYFSDPDEITNLGLPALLFYLLTPTQAGWVLRLTVVAVAVWMFVRPGDTAIRSEAAENAGTSSPLTLPDLYRIYLLIGVHTLLLYPALYPWYLVWLIPLLCFFPSLGWFYFSWASSLVYTTWPTPTWALWVEYVPLYLLLRVELASRKEKER
jgi:hypothetical protein